MLAAGKRTWLQGENQTMGKKSKKYLLVGVTLIFYDGRGTGSGEDMIELH